MTDPAAAWLASLIRHGETAIAMRQVPSGTGSALPNLKREGDLPLVTRTSLAESAGISEHQRKTAREAQS